MIHVAPCSCELHVRIRELEETLRNSDLMLREFVLLAEKAEAELERRQEVHQKCVAEYEARAEKAQAAETRIRQEKAENDLFWSRKVSDLQARVAELVNEIKLIIRHYKIEDYDLTVLRDSKEVYRYKDGRTIPVVRARKPAPAIEGHEREAD